MKFNGKKLSKKDTKEILEELKNPNVDPVISEMLKKAGEVYRNSKENEFFQRLAKEKAYFDATSKDAIYMDKMKSIVKLKEKNFTDNDIADFLNLEEDIYKELLQLIEEKGGKNGY